MSIQRSDFVDIKCQSWDIGDLSISSNILILIQKNMADLVQKFDLRRKKYREKVSKLALRSVPSDNSKHPEKGLC